MSDYKSILFATDFSENADKAFREAQGLTRDKGAKLIVLNVVPIGEELVAAGDQAPSWLPDEDKVIARLDETYGSGDMNVESAVRYGAPARRILEFAESEGVDLIVIGARGVGAIVGFFGGGSIADKVVKNSKVPVLVVPA
jgi:nucleotide-binding universal stress UspA family protein